MIKLYSKDDCPACDQTKKLLGRLKVEFTEFNLMEDEDKLEMFKTLGYKQMPIIEIDGEVYSTGFRPDMLRKLGGN